MEVITIAGTAKTKGRLDGKGTSALLSHPTGIVCDKNGNIYFCESENHCVRVIYKNGDVKTLCGNGKPGFADGIGSEALFSSPRDITFDKDGNLIVADMDNGSIRKVTKDGVVSTISGSPTRGQYQDGPASQAAFCKPYGLCYDESEQSIYICDTFNHCIRKIDKDSNVSTVCGSKGNSGTTDGKGSNARLYWPVGITCDKKGGLYVADSGNHTIRKLTKDGVLTTLCGKGGSTGYIDGSSQVAKLNGPFTFAYDSRDILYFTEFHNHSIRTLSEDGDVRVFAGLNSKGDQNGKCEDARFNYPWGIAFDVTTGNLIISDKENHTIRAIVGVAPKVINFYALDYMSLLQNSETVSDFHFTFRKRIFHLHKCILYARCEKLMGENELSLLECISDSHVDNAFEWLLKFVYGLPSTELHLVNISSLIFLQRMAQLLKLPMLSSYCISLLNAQLSTANVATVYKIASEHGINDSFSCIRKFLKTQSSDFVQKFTGDHKFDLEGPETITTPVHLPDDSNMRMDMSNLFTQLKFADFIIKVEDKELFCHRAILYSRCTFFRAMLSSHMQETVKGTLSFPDPKEPNGMTFSSMKCLLCYFYCNDLEQLKDPVDALFILANSEYLMLTEEKHQDLIEKCELTLQENITEENCIEVLHYSDILGAAQATQIALDMLKKNQEKIQKQLKEKKHLIPKELLAQDETLSALINSIKL